MSDISERLRLYARHFEDLHAPQNVTIGMREAAAKIEHLREEAEFNYMAGYDAAKDDYRDMLQERENEIERLRAALKDARVSVEGWADYASDYIKEKWDLKGDLARIDAALKGK